MKTDLIKAKEAFAELLGNAENKIEAINELKEFIHKNSPLQDQAVDYVIWMPIENVEPNTYNPNSVAHKEMGLLYLSIKEDSYTQPIVAIWDEDKKKAVIVDGFHRYFVAKTNPDILERNHGHVPVVLIKKSINDRMASTVRHNRARGKHSVDGMSSMIFQMLDEGWTDSEICNKLGLEAEELLKLKHITGFSKLFEDVEYQKAWKTKRQIIIEKEYKENE